MTIDQSAVTTGEEQVADTEVQAPVEEDLSAFLEQGFKSAQPDDGSAPPEPEPETDPEPAGTLPEGMTREELLAAIEAARELPKVRQQYDSLAGRIGSTNQALEALQKAPTVQWKPEDFKAVYEQFPEVAAALAEDMNGKMRMAQAVDPASIGQVVNEQVQAALRQERADRIPKVLSRQHPEWRELMGFDADNKPTGNASPEFANYVKSLPAERQDAYRASWDADEISEFIAGFKSEKQKAAAKKEQRVVNLRGAIAPRGGGGASRPSTLSLEELAAVGFKKVRQGG